MATRASDAGMAAEEELRPAQPRAGIRLGDHTAGHNDLDDLDGDGQWAAAGGRPRARPAAARPPALPGDENEETSRGALRPREGGGLLVYVVVCAMVCGRGVRVDGEALPLRRVSFGLGRRRLRPAPRNPGAGSAPARRLRRAAARRRRRRQWLEATRWQGERRAARVRALAAAHAAPSHSRAHLLTRAVRARVQVPHRGRGPAERRGDGTRWRRSEGRGGGGGRRATGRSEVERGGGVARAEAEAKRGAEAAEARTEADGRTEAEASGGAEGTREFVAGGRAGGWG